MLTILIHITTCMTRRVEFLQLPNNFNNSFALQERRKGKEIKRRRKKRKRKKKKRPEE